MATAQRRPLDFATFDQVLADVDRLHRAGYVQYGQWDLAQILDHLRYFLQGSLEGFSFRAPWWIRKLLGPRILKKLLRQRRMKEGWPTPQRPLPEPGGDEAEAILRFQQTVAEFEQQRRELHPSPLFGPLPYDQWRQLHLVHCAHHLSFLHPKDEA